MSEHCVIDGERCSKCCEVLTIKQTGNMREWLHYIRRWGYPDEYNGDKLYHMLRQVSKRRAKKMNPDLVKEVNNNQSYFTCKNFTGAGCGDYENRPRICSAFPLYGRTVKEWEASDEYKRGGLYHIKCTFHTGEV